MRNFGKEWFLFAEDSAKLFDTTTLQLIQQRIVSYSESDTTEIIKIGYRRTTGSKAMKILDLDTMEVIPKEACVFFNLGKLEHVR